MSNFPPNLIRVSKSIVDEYGLDAIKRWSNDPVPEIAKTFKECLEAAGVAQK